MKYILFFCSVFLAFNTFSQGNTGNRNKNNHRPSSTAPKPGAKPSANEVSMEELHLKNKPAPSNQQVQPKNEAPQKTKLDDLKNPFDTTKKIKPNHSATLQNSSHDRYANIETNLKQDNKQGQQVTYPDVNKTKLDDLKNPFDTTKRVVASKNTVQQNGTNQRTTGSRTRQGGKRN
jgi:hypothetical protein